MRHSPPDRSEAHTKSQGRPAHRTGHDSKGIRAGDRAGGQVTFRTAFSDPNGLETRSVLSGSSRHSPSTMNR